MRLNWKAAVALVIGGIALGGVASSFAANGGAPGSGPHGSKAFFMHGPIVRSTTIVEGEDEGTFKTLQDDAGELTSVNGNTLTVEQADGKSVEITVDAATTYMRDHEEASLSDLKSGDHVFVHRVDGVTEHVGAISPEEWSRMEAEREACEADESSCPRRFHTERRGPGPDGDGPSVERAPEPASDEAVVSLSS